MKIYLQNDELLKIYDMKIFLWVKNVEAFRNEWEKFEFYYYYMEIMWN